MTSTRRALAIAGTVASTLSAGCSGTDVEATAGASAYQLDEAYFGVVLDGLPERRYMVVLAEEDVCDEDYIYTYAYESRSIAFSLTSAEGSQAVSGSFLRGGSNAYVVIGTVTVESFDVEGAPDPTLPSSPPYDDVSGTIEGTVDFTVTDGASDVPRGVAHGTFSADHCPTLDALYAASQ